MNLNYTPKDYMAEIDVYANVGLLNQYILDVINTLRINGFYQSLFAPDIQNRGIAFIEKVRDHFEGQGWKVTLKPAGSSYIIHISIP
jgi:hypothetical protein